MVGLHVVMLEIRAVVAACGPYDDAEARRLADRAIVWIGDPKLSAVLHEELADALSRSAVFAALNGGVPQPGYAKAVDAVLEKIDAASPQARTTDPL